MLQFKFRFTDLGAAEAIPHLPTAPSPQPPPPLCKNLNPRQLTASTFYNKTYPGSVYKYDQLYAVLFWDPQSINQPKSVDASCFRSQSLKAIPTIPTRIPSFDLKVQAIPRSKLGTVSKNTAYFGLFGSLGCTLRP